MAQGCHLSCAVINILKNIAYSKLEHLRWCTEHAVQELSCSEDFLDFLASHLEEKVFLASQKIVVEDTARFENP
eukprot:778379-Amphidinium_carterae.1